MEKGLSYIIEKAAGVTGQNGLKVRLVSKMMKEAMSDIRESSLHPDIAGMYFGQLAAMTHWIATGEWKHTLPIPDDFNPDAD
jgi:hypothetical protein